MKIAYLVNQYPAPSHSFIRREILALEARGIPVERLAIRSSAQALVDPGDQAEADRTFHLLDQGKGTVLKQALREASRAPGAALKALGLAWRYGRRSQVGVLRHMIYLAEALALMPKLRARQVTHIHAHFGTNPATVCALIDALGGPGFSFTVHGPEEFDKPEALSLGDKVARSRFTCAVSRFGRSQLMRWAAPDHWDRLKVVHCGLDLSRFENPAPMPDGPLRLVSIGRFAEQKGQLILIDAMAQVVATTPEVHLTLVGDGDLRPQIEDRIAALNLESHVTLAGWLDDSGVREALAQAHALVLPSFAEGLPVVIMEAMAAHRPVISTYVAGIPELVRQDEVGWLVPASDANALARTINAVSEMTPTALADFGLRAAKRVARRHDVRESVTQLERYFVACDNTPQVK